MATTLPKPVKGLTRTSDMPLLGASRHVNLSPAQLYEKAIARGEGILAANGPLVVHTGKHTGRSPKDKFLVDEPDAHANVWWGGFNTPISEERYANLRARIIEHMNQREVFVQEGYVGADQRYRRSLRAYTESAWASIFCDNLFIRPRLDELVGFEPNFTIVNASTFKADPERDGTRSETVILVHLAKQRQVAGAHHALRGLVEGRRHEPVLLAQRGAAGVAHARSGGPAARARVGSQTVTGESAFAVRWLGIVRRVSTTAVAHASIRNRCETARVRCP